MGFLINMKKKTKESQGMLLFKLNKIQTFAMGTLKIREIVPFCHLSMLLGSHETMIGSANIRGITTPVIDMAKVIGYPAVNKEEYNDCFIIITDCQRRVVGFLVRHIEKISACDWKNITPPPQKLGSDSYLTGVLQIDNKIIQLLDVELIMSKVFPITQDKLHPILADVDREKLKLMRIILIDDSSIARKQLSEALDSINIPYVVCINGLDALNIMKAAAENGKPFDIVVSDIEMPGIDGYELAFEIRNNEEISEAYLILHSSLSSAISLDRAQQVGAHEALSKFDANELVKAMLRGAKLKTKGEQVKQEGSIL